MTPEQTFINAVASGQLPFGAALLLLIGLVLYRGSGQLRELTIAVQAVPAALVEHRAEVKTAHAEVKTHVTNEAERVIAVIEDRRMSEVGDAVAEVKRAVSDPDLPAVPARSRTGSHRATR